VFGVACSLVRLKVPDLTIVAILLEPSFGISESVLEKKRNARQYAERQVNKAKTAAETSFTLNQYGKPTASNQNNVRLGLSKLGITVRYDSFSDVMVLEGHNEFKTLDDASLDWIWLELDARFEFRPNQTFLKTVIEVDARKDAFHPVCDYLAGLVWDGVERIDTWLVTYAGAKDTPYTRAVGRLMLLAAVRRVRQPGCKFDELPVLESPTQGTDKSTAIAILAVKDD
jgi:hypothetical protein